MASILKTDKIEGVTASGTVAMPAGHVIQTVNATHATQASTTSASYVATALNASITPKFSTSKILVTFTVPTYATSGKHCACTVFRESGTASSGSSISGTNLGDATWGFSSVYAGSSDIMASVHCTGVLDSPSTTSATRYTVAFKQVNTGTSEVFVNGAMGTLTLQEIAQ
tara:strand:+ start:978 stop:1487 length:510 start_codon:yes stop_codon:yes gene_type:complete